MRPTDIVIDAEKVFLFDCVTELNNLYYLTCLILLRYQK